MVWGCFWGTMKSIGRSKLYLLDRDVKLKQHGYSANSHIEVLDDQLSNYWEPWLIFMQDGARNVTLDTQPEVDCPPLVWSIDSCIRCPLL